MTDSRPLILISNDDGYQSKGIVSLVSMVSPLADVVVCAPEGPRSGFSCAFSATTPLLLTRREQREGVEVWSCNGTPVDCVKMALARVVRQRPNLVLGGINHGDNSSVNAHYSGTMGVALEGAMKGIPSVAFSLCDHREEADFEPLRPYVERIVEQVLRDGLPEGLCLNVNFPLRPSFLGVKVCRMSRGQWVNEITTCHHPRGYDYHWMVGHYANSEPSSSDTDRWALEAGYVAITPTRVDVTDYDSMALLRERFCSAS